MTKELSAEIVHVSDSGLASIKFSEPILLNPEVLLTKPNDHALEIKILPSDDHQAFHFNDWEVLIFDGLHLTI